MSLSRETVQTLVTGEHGDPFAVLGPHAAADGVIVRAFLPGAVEVSVVPLDAGPLSHPLKPLHPAGLWEGAIPGRLPLAYRFRASYGGGRMVEIEDPYRFPPTLSGFDLHLLGEGTHYRIYDKLGAHAATLEGVPGVIFAVWAPNAKRVSVVGDWNAWDGRRHPMRLHPGNGIWELFVPGVVEGARYKFEILDRWGKPLALKADPFAFAFEPDTPRTASVVADLDGHQWRDAEWMEARARHRAHERPMAVYEIHMGSSRTARGGGARYRG